MGLCYPPAPRVTAMSSGSSPKLRSNVSLHQRTRTAGGHVWPYCTQSLYQLEDRIPLMQINSTESARSLRNLYFVRTVFQVIWAAAVLSTARAQPHVASILLIAYPLW